MPSAVSCFISATRNCPSPHRLRTYSFSVSHVARSPPPFFPRLYVGCLCCEPKSKSSRYGAVFFSPPSSLCRHFLSPIFLLNLISFPHGHAPSLFPPVRARPNEENLIPFFPPSPAFSPSLRTIFLSSPRPDNALPSPLPLSKAAGNDGAFFHKNAGFSFLPPHRAAGAPAPIG